MLHSSRTFSFACFRHRRQRCIPQRAGAALVEFALTVPIVILIVATAMEFSRANMVRNALDNAAFDGARAGIVPGATAADIQQRCELVLHAAMIRDAEVKVAPAVIHQDTTEVQISISVPWDSNFILAPTFFHGQTINKTCLMAREGFHTIQEPQTPTATLPVPRGRGRCRSRL